MKAARVLNQRALPGDRHRKERLSFATTIESWPACVSQLANVLLKSFGVAFGIFKHPDASAAARRRAARVRLAAMPAPARNSLLTRAEVAELCTLAQEAWDAVPKPAESATFSWRGLAYVANRRSSRLVVHAPSGLPVACRWD